MSSFMSKLADFYLDKRKQEEARLNKVYEYAKNFDNIRELISEKADLELKIEKCEFLNESHIDLDKKYAKVCTDLKALTKEKGIDLDRHYDCEICKDSGKVGDRLCKCAMVEYIKILRRESGINSVAKFTFKDNKVNEKNCRQGASLSRLYDILEKYCDKFPNNKIKAFTFSGTVGAGKTCLLSSVANALLEKGYFVYYLSAGELNDIFLSYHLASLGDKARVFEPLLEADALIIDDLGTEPIRKDVTVNYFYKLIEERMANDKTIMITTNLSLDALKERYSSRTISRLTAKNKGVFGEFGGDDLRTFRELSD